MLLGVNELYKLVKLIQRTAFAACEIVHSTLALNLREKHEKSTTSQTPFRCVNIVYVCACAFWHTCVSLRVVR